MEASGGGILELTGSAGGSLEQLTGGIIQALTGSVVQLTGNASVTGGTAYHRMRHGRHPTT